MEDSGKRVIEFKYIFEDSYNPKYVNGVHGGPTPSGDLVMHFYLERTPLPNTVVHDVDESGALIPDSLTTSPPAGKPALVRVVENGVVMNLSFALILRNWLSEQLKSSGFETSISDQNVKR